MTNLTEEFVLWMDRNNLSPKDISTALNAEIQTIRHWRSSGIPKRREAHIRMFMEQWDAQNTPHHQHVNITHPFTLHPTIEQFKIWDSAAALDGKNIFDWALDELEAAACESLELKSKTKTTPFPGYQSPETPAQRVAEGGGK